MTTDAPVTPTEQRDGVLTAINDLWFEWDLPLKRGRGSATFTRAVAQEARNALVRLLHERATLIPAPSEAEPYALGFASAIEVVRDVSI